MAGYGKNMDWIQEYEHLIGRKLKTFTISDQHMIDMFEVINTSIYSVKELFYSLVKSSSLKMKSGAFS